MTPAGAWPLFAVVLEAWSDSLGVAPVGMARVLWAERIALGLVVALLALAVAALRGLRLGASPALRKAAFLGAAGLLGDSALGGRAGLSFRVLDPAAAFGLACRGHDDGRSGARRVRTRSEEPAIRTAEAPRGS